MYITRKFFINIDVAIWKCWHKRGAILNDCDGSSMVSDDGVVLKGHFFEGFISVLSDGFDAMGAFYSEVEEVWGKKMEGS